MQNYFNCLAINKLKICLKPEIKIINKCVLWRMVYKKPLFLNFKIMKFITIRNIEANFT